MKLVAFFLSFGRSRLKRSGNSMKITTSLNFTILFLLGFAIPVTGHCQTFYVDGGMSGGFTFTVSDGSFGSGGSTGAISYFQETVFLDTIAGTIRQTGTVYLAASSATVRFQDTQQVIQPFPNPPVTVSGDLTVTLNFAGAVLPFDTGTQSASWDGYVYTFPGPLPVYTLPMNGSYSLVTGGETYTGSFNYSLHTIMGWGVDSSIFAFTQLDPTGYPDTILLSGNGVNRVMNTEQFVLAGGPSSLTASNGYTLKFTLGSTERWIWGTNVVTATRVSPSSPPTITSQPQPVLVHSYDNASFSVSASGAMPLSYQWSLNGTNITGATASSLVVSNVTQSDLGEYAVVVTNRFGTLTSSNAMLSMYPFLAAPFTGAITTWGKPAVLSVGAWGTGPLSYQWYMNGTEIGAATDATLTFTNIQFTNAGLYSAVVSSALGSATNPPAQVVVNAAGVSLGFCPALTISGVAGYSYIIQSAPNLTDTNAWVTRTNLTLIQPVELWVDTNVDASSPFNSRYYYRVLPGAASNP
jgi:hypothetical protein